MNNSLEKFLTIWLKYRLCQSLYMNLEEYGYENMDFILNKPGIVQNLDELLRLCIETKFPDCLDLDISTSLEVTFHETFQAIILQVLKVIT